MSIQPQTTETASTTTQTCIPNNALVTDVRRVLEDNREIASFTYREEPFYATRIQTELKKRFGWDVDTDTVYTAIDELGADVVKSCARPHYE